MTKNELIALGLEEDMATKVAEASKKELEGYVEKSKLDLANTEKETLQAQAKEYTKQLETLKKSAGDAEAMKAKIEELQAANRQAKADYDTKVKAMQKDYAVEAALKTANAKNLTAVRALLDLDSVEVDEAGKVTGLDKQIKKLQEAEDSKFLFEAPADPKGGKPDSGLKGGKPDEGSGGDNPPPVSIGAQMAQQYNAMFAPAEKA